MIWWVCPCIGSPKIMFANSVSSCIQNAVDTLQLFGCIMKPWHASSPLQIVCSEEGTYVGFRVRSYGLHISTQYTMKIR